MAGKDDLKNEQNLKRIDDLETFRSDYEGKNFDKKVLTSIKEYSELKEEIKNIAWVTFKEKIHWFLFGGIGVVIIDLFLRAIPHLITIFKP